MAVPVSPKYGVHVVPAQREREADEEEADETEAEDGEVGAHHVSRVLRPTEAGLDERESGLHEDDEDGAEHHPQHVGGVDDRCDRVIGLGEGDAAAEQRHERRAGGASEDVLQRSFPTHRLSLFRGPQTWMRPPGRSVRQFERPSVSAGDPPCFGFVAFLREPLTDGPGIGSAESACRPGRPGHRPAARSSNLRPSRSLIAKRSTRRSSLLATRALWIVTPEAASAAAIEASVPGRLRPVTVQAVCHGRLSLSNSTARSAAGSTRTGPRRPASIRSASARSPRADGRPDEERVDHRTVRPGGQRRPGDVAAGVVEGRGEVGQEGVAVAAGDVDDPVVGRPFGADRHSDRCRAGQGLDEPSLTGELLGVVGEQVGGRRGAQPIDGRGSVASCSASAAPRFDDRRRVRAEQLGVIEEAGDQRVQLVQPVAVAFVGRAGHGEEVGDLEGVARADVGRQLQQLGLAVPVDVAGAAPRRRADDVSTCSTGAGSSTPSSRSNSA